jgi:diguanylate cyclase (GGDEF)-like protein
MLIMTGENASGCIGKQDLGLADAWRLSWTGQLDSALQRATQLMAAATARRDDRARAECSLLIGECSLHLGRLDDALDHAQVAARIFNLLEEPGFEARARALHAWVLLTRADTELALDEVLAALEIAKGTDDAVAQAAALDATGMVYWLIQQPAKALEFFEEAVRLARETGDDVHFGRFLINMGGAQAQLGLAAQNSGDPATFDRLTRLGIDSTAQGLAISKQGGDLWSVRIALCNIAEYRCRLDDYAGALDELAEHDAIPGRLDDRAAVHYQFTRGIVLAGLGRFDEAITQFQASLAAEANGDFEQAVTSMLHISKAYESAGRFAEALAAYKKYHALQIRLAAEEAQRRARYVALRFENEKLRALATAEQTRAQTLESENHDLAREADRLARVVHEDDLTKLSNRRHLEAAMFEVLVSGERYAIAMIDVDSFKHINDTFSHAAGDEVLRRIGKLIRQCCRENDLPVRYGGEEFAILMRGADQQDARKICDRVKSVIELHDWRALLAGGGVTVSIGVAAWSEAGTPNSVLILADRRLYRAKAEGRNRVVDGEWQGA